MSTAEDVGSRIFFAPASKYTCMVFASFLTLLIVPPMLILPNTHIYDWIGLRSDALLRATKVQKTLFHYFKY